MKKLIGFIMLVVMTTIMVACDDDEKSFDALDLHNIPNKVTENFYLERGNYGKFEWSSNKLEVISVVNNEAIVTQQETDVLVTLTAKINNTKRDFDVLVLKIGSEKSSYERTKTIIEIFKDVIIIDKKGKLLPNVISDVYIKYSVYQTEGENKYKLEKREDGIFLTSLVGENDSYIVDFNMIFYEDELMSEELYIYKITLKFI